MPPYDLRLKPNFKLFIHGPSRSGKTHFIGDLLKNKDVFTQEPPKLVVYVYRVIVNFQVSQIKFRTQFSIDVN